MASPNEKPDPILKITPLTPELREWALRQYTDEEIIAGLREAKEHGGPELGELIHEMEQDVIASEHRPHA